MKSYFLRTALVFVVLMSANTVDADPIFVTDSVTGQLTGAIGVQVSGDYLNIRFEAGTCADLFGGCNEGSDFGVGQGEGTANILSAELANTLSGIDPTSIKGCAPNSAGTCDIYTPHTPPNPQTGRISSAITRVFSDGTARWVGSGGLFPTDDISGSPFSTFGLWSQTQIGEHWDMPYLPGPVGPGDPFEFVFDAQAGQTVFIDPDIAIGYDYALSDGTSPLFSSVTAPTGFGDNLFERGLWDGLDFVFDSVVEGGVEHAFGSGGVDRFRLLGIEESEEVDPTDPLGFVTGVSFLSSGTVNMTQNAITTNVVPVPATAWLFGSALGLLGWMRRKAP